MNVAKKIEIALREITNLAGQEGVDYAIRIAALENLEVEIATLKTKLAAERDAAISDALGGEPG